jgi:LacI family transcriptional regulator
MPLPKCSLRTIAKACNCSVATVSMALRGLGRVPVATRQHIEKMAAKLGYVRDLEMSRLMSRARRPSQPVTREQLAFLSELPLGSKPPPQSHWLHSMFEAARDAAHLLGYELEPITLHADATSQKKLSRKLYAQGVRGLLAGPVTTWSPAILQLEWNHFACVEIGTTIQEPSLHRVERSFYDDLLELYAHLRTIGYRRIGLAMPKIRLEYMRHMPEATLLLFQQQHPDMQILDPLCTMNEWSQAGLKRWLKEQNPDVIVIYEPQVTHWLQRLKIRVPQDLGVVDLSSVGGSQTGLVPDINLLARESIHLLIRLVEGAEWGLPHRARSHRFRNIFNPGKTIAGAADR